MNQNLLVVLSWLTIGLLVFAGARQAEQEPGRNPLDDRVDKLEKRVQLLERIVFSSARLSANQAQRQVDEARSRLNHSQALHARGMINDLELQRDRYEFEEAKKAKELSIAESRQNELVGELEVLDAEQRLRQVEQQLRYTETLASRGYASQNAVDAIKKQLDTAQQRLDNAKIKLDAARQLESIK